MGVVLLVLKLAALVIGLPVAFIVFAIVGALAMESLDPTPPD